jgi:hypothetical protein
LMARYPLSTNLLVKMSSEVVVRLEDDVAAVYCIVDVEPVRPGDE